MIHSKAYSLDSILTRAFGSPSSGLSSLMIIDRRHDEYSRPFVKASSPRRKMTIPFNYWVWYLKKTKVWWKSVNRGVFYTQMGEEKTIKNTCFEKRKEGLTVVLRAKMSLASFTVPKSVLRISIAPTSIELMIQCLDLGAPFDRNRLPIEICCE